MGLVARFVVGVGLGPVGGVDGGDATGAVEVEGAAAGVGVVDRGEVAVGAVGVAAVEDPLCFGGGRVRCPGRPGGGLECAGGCCGEGLAGEATGRVPGVGEGEAVADGAGDFLTGGVVVEGEDVAGDVHGGAVAAAS